MIRHTWQGPNGELIDLSDTGAGVWLTDGGIEGMGNPPTTPFTRASPSVAGQTLTGFSTGPRSVFWPVAIDAGIRSWEQNQARFWDSLIPGEMGTWTVSHNGSLRTLECRFEDDGGKAYDFDPSHRGIEIAGVTLTADKPFWRGPQVSRMFLSAVSAGTFFASSGSAHVFSIGSGGNTDAATLSNPGDVPAWPVITISGPSEAFSVTVDGAEISATLALASGDRLVIDTDPTRQVARIWRGRVSSLFPFFNFTSIGFAPVPRGGSVPVAITANGSGPIDIAFYPQFRRAF